MAAARSLNDLTFDMLQQQLEHDGVRPIHAKPLWTHLYRNKGREGFLPPLQRWMETMVPSHLALDKPEVVADTRSSDGLTRKFLLRLQDAQEVETVLMGYPGRYTACLSTQAGCAMGCTFCATGQMGFVRHLRPGEIVAQVLQCKRALQDNNPDAPGLRNLVFMGMGEPLHNYDSVMQALDIITDRRGINIAPSKVTISTVGVIPSILRMAEERRPYNLAVSLHGATEEERSALVPVSRRWPLKDLIEACHTYNRITQKRIFFGWTLIAGVNDSPEQAHRVVELLKGLDAHVNLIPLNPTHGYDGVEAPEAAGLRFQQILLDAGIPSTFRQRRGIDVAAGCGMLKAEKRKNLPTAKATQG